MIAVPYHQLRPATLQMLIEEFVTRDGAVHGHMETSLQDMIEAVREQLKSGLVWIAFDEETETCTIVPQEQTA